MIDNIDLYVATSKFAAKVAQIFSEADVPSVLFSWVVVGLYDDITEFRDIEFVVPDAYIPAAI
ncbi:hypothetical protein BDW69DRAFT_179791 [Aspergillus filifer]